MAAVAMVAGATGDSAPRPDPEIFVGYSTKEVGYVLSEELGRLIKSQEHRPANKSAPTCGLQPAAQKPARPAQPAILVSASNTTAVIGAAASLRVVWLVAS